MEWACEVSSSVGLHVHHVPEVRRKAKNATKTFSVCVDPIRRVEWMQGGSCINAVGVRELNVPIVVRHRGLQIADLRYKEQGCQGCLMKRPLGLSEGSGEEDSCDETGLSS